MMHKVKIVMTGHGRGTVIVDGTEVHWVRAIETRCAHGEVNTVTLTLLADEVEFDSEARIVANQVGVQDVAG